MNIKFNKAQLSRTQKQSLFGILDVLQAENELEIVVDVVDFPEKLKVKLDDEVEMLLGWDVKEQSYAGLTTPESTESKPKLGSDLATELGIDNLQAEEQRQENELEPEINIDLDMAGKVIEPELEPKHGTEILSDEPELDLSPVVERAEALARALVKLSIPLNIEQRIEVWMKFCFVLSKELWK